MGKWFCMVTRLMSAGGLEASSCLSTSSNADSSEMKSLFSSFLASGMFFSPTKSWKPRIGYTVSRLYMDVMYGWTAIGARPCDLA